MRELRLVAVSEDGAHLILRTEGEESPMALPVDERLHAAIRGDRARLGQLEIQLESQLRPRDIQARVRAGESVESVAAAAAVPLDRVMRYAGAVLAEREHVAGRARRATVRRMNGDGPAPTLDDAVTRWVGQSSVDPETVVWDAWRRDDGRWQVSASWRSGSDPQSARFAFDPAGRSASPDDDQARAVAGDRPPEPVIPPGPARLSVIPRVVAEVDDPATGEPSLVAGPTVIDVSADGVDEYPVGDPADDQPTAPVPVAGRTRRDAAGRNGRRRNGARTSQPRDDLWAPPAADERPTSDRLRLTDIANRVEVEDDDPPADPVPATPAPGGRAASARSRRPSVPSWDEIMFGRRRKPD
ncbi:MAG: septation protein SepH [Jiangellaceae bacterium]